MDFIDDDGIGSCVADACEQCYSEDSCLLRNGLPICSAYFIPGTMTPGIGVIDNGNRNFTLSNTNGGQILQFDVALVDTPTLVTMGYTAVDGTTPIYPCSPYIVVPIVPEGRITIQCTIGEGSGVNMVMILRACHLDNVTCATVKDNNATFSWPGPTITSSTLYFPPLGAKAATQTLKNTLATEIAFEGTNFYGAGMKVYYGPTSNPTVNPCALRLASTTSTLIWCTTSGTSFVAGANLFVVIMDDGRSAHGSDILTFPTNVPEIKGVAGCTSAPNNKTSGGTILTIFGQSLNDPLTVSINGASCGAVNPISSEMITCQLPPGTGFDTQVTVSSGDQFSAPKPYLSYAAPKIDSIEGCNAPLNEDPLQTERCMRGGGQRITIRGSNFGESDATVLIGSDPCQSVSHGEVGGVNRNGVLMCTLPKGNRDDRPVLVIQKKGEISTTIALVSYLQCSPGQLEVGFSCFPCDRGTYTNSASQTGCLSCVPGFYADQQQMVNTLLFLPFLLSTLLLIWPCLRSRHHVYHAPQGSIHQQVH
jgi:hypothetical protein